MGKTALFIGRRETAANFVGFEKYFQLQGYEIQRFETLKEATPVLRQKKVDVCVVYAFGDIFSDMIDAYEGELPPVVYWYITRADELPQRQGVTPIKSIAMPSEVYRLAEELVGAQ